MVFGFEDCGFGKGRKVHVGSQLGSMFGEEGFGGRRENKLLGLLWVCDNEQG